MIISSGLPCRVVSLVKRINCTEEEGEVDPLDQVIEKHEEKICGISCRTISEHLDNSSTIPDHCPMRRIGDIIAGRNRQIGQIMTIRSRWADIAGEVLAAHSEPVVIRNKVLQVLCDSPAWAQQVGLLSKAIEEQVRKIAGIRVQKVEGKFGMVRKSPPRTKTVRPIGRLAIDPEDIEKLRDPALARAVRELAEGEGSRDG